VRAGISRGGSRADERRDGEARMHALYAIDRDAPMRVAPEPGGPAPVRGYWRSVRRATNCCTRGTSGGRS
jgi:hypothetical protein